jgi:hypothetical protein
MPWRWAFRVGSVSFFRLICPDNDPRAAAKAPTTDTAQPPPGMGVPSANSSTKLAMVQRGKPGLSMAPAVLSIFHNRFKNIDNYYITVELDLKTIKIR